jgi:hypothetical protein
MPSHNGPNTNEEGLVFSFNVNDYNSFKGQPGINLGSGPNFGYSSSGLSEYENGKLIRWKSYTEKAHIPTLGVKDVKTIEWYNIYSGYGVDGNYQCCPTIFTYSPNGWNSTILEPSTEYMYQIIYKSASGYTHPNYMYHYERSVDDSQGTEFGVYSTGRRTHLGDGWYHAWGSFTTQSYTVKGYFGCWHYEYNTKNKVSLAAVSLIKGNSVRPPAQFIDEGVTLSNTEALLDLTGNSTIDLTNVSFDSNAQMTFDGTDDYGSLGNPTVLRELTSGTIETVYYRDASTGTYQMIFTDAGSDLEITYSGNVLQFYIGNSGLSYSHAVTGQWFYVTGTWGPGSKKLYINGVEVASGTNTGIDTGNRDRFIGGRGTSFPFNGKIPMVKVLTRALTASEIQANYNAIKGIFNIE